MDSASTPDYSITLRRNASMSPGAQAAFLAWTGVFCLGLAGALAWLGYWLVLPFSGLEIVALLAAFRHLNRQKRDFQRISLQGDILTVETCVRQQCSVAEFNRYWVQVLVRDGRYYGDCLVVLRSHGRELEIGGYMTGEQRAALARELKTILRRGTAPAC